ncbi:MAG: hypothetical protein AB7R67_20250 [Vicinamibacterales bacterium]
MAGTAGAAGAQTLDLVADRAALGVDAPMPANLDGQATTREWVQSRYSPTDGQYEVRGLALRASGLCVGTWFRPFDVAAAQLLPGDMLLVGVLAESGDRHRFIAYGVIGYYEVSIGYGCTP